MVNFKIFVVIIIVVQISIAQLHNPNLVAGTYEWEKNYDNYGSSAIVTKSEKDISFTFNLVTTKEYP